MTIPTQQRTCRFCGREFVAVRANFCSAKCRDRQLHAVQMLAGTHGYVDGRRVRLKAHSEREAAG